MTRPRPGSPPCSPSPSDGQGQGVIAGVGFVFHTSCRYNTRKARLAQSDLHRQQDATQEPLPVQPGPSVARLIRDLRGTGTVTAGGWGGMTEVTPCLSCVSQRRSLPLLATRAGGGVDAPAANARGACGAADPSPGTTWQSQMLSGVKRFEGIKRFEVSRAPVSHPVEEAILRVYSLHTGPAWRMVCQIVQGGQPLSHQVPVSHSQ